MPRHHDFHHPGENIVELLPVVAVGMESLVVLQGDGYKQRLDLPVTKL